MKRLIVFLLFLSVTSINTLFGAATSAPVRTAQALTSLDGRNNNLYNMMGGQYSDPWGSRYRRGPFLSKRERAELSYKLDRRQAEIDNMPEDTPEQIIKKAQRQAAFTARRTEIEKKPEIGDYFMAAFLGDDMASLLQGVDLKGDKDIWYKTSVGCCLKIVDAFGRGISSELQDGTKKSLGLLLRHMWEFLNTNCNPQYYYRVYLCGRSGTPFTVNDLKAHNIYVLALLMKLSQQVKNAASNSDRAKGRRHDGVPGEVVLEDEGWTVEKDDLAKELEFVAADIIERMGYYYENGAPDKFIRHGASKAVKWIRKAATIIREANQDIDLASVNNQRALARCIDRVTDNFVYIKNYLGLDVTDNFVNVKTKPSYGGYSSSPSYGGGGAFGGGMR